MTALAKSFEEFCRVFYRFYCPLVTVGRDNLPSPPFILCSNHTSHMDSTVLMTASGMPFNQFGMLAAQDYFFDNPTRKKFLPSMMSLIPLDRKSGRDAILKNLEICRAFAVQGKRNLILYPEGTRSQTGQLQPFKKGAGLFATELRVPIVPAYIRGSYSSFPKGILLPRPRTIQVLFGAPIFPEELGNASLERPLVGNKHLYRRLTDELEGRVKELSENI